MAGDATCPCCGALVWFTGCLLSDELNFIRQDRAHLDLGRVTKEDAVRAMVASLVRADAIPQAEADHVCEAVLRRESYGSTGIGRGVAVPHAKHSTVQAVVASLGLSREGIDFQSLDGRPVHVIFLIISPENRPGDHMRALERISRHLRKPEFEVWKEAWLAGED